jgi:hypothetical protein
MARVLAEQLAPFLQALPAALAQAVATVQAKRPPCAVCVTRRLRWEATHNGVLDAANAMAEAATARIQEMLAEAHERQESLDPESVPSQNPHDYLPEELRPHPTLPYLGDRMPVVMDSLTDCNGTAVCMFDLPGVPAISEDGQPVATEAAEPEQPGKTPLLLAKPGMSVTTAANLARQNHPSLPGYAEQ